MVTATVDDLFVITVGKFGEVGTKTSTMLTFEAVNIDPNEMFEMVRKLSEGVFQVLNGTMCAVLLDLEAQMIEITLATPRGFSREEVVLKSIVDMVRVDLASRARAMLPTG